MSASRSVRFEDEADSEYSQAGRWYEDRRAGLGVEFFDAVDAAIHHIAAFPQGGIAVPRASKQFLIRRVPVSRFPYHVVYLEIGTAIRIQAMAHDRRRPGFWKHRLS